jgi:NADH-quinone oxidoreductase subunit M
MLWMFQRVNYGVVTNPKNESLNDLSVREWWAIGPTVALAVLMGVLPMLFLRPIEPSVTRMVQRMQSRQERTVQATPVQTPVERPVPTPRSRP